MKDDRVRKSHDKEEGRADRRSYASAGEFSVTVTVEYDMMT